MVEAVLAAVKELQEIVDDSKENIEGGLHLRLCNATQVVHDKAEALKRENNSDNEDEGNYQRYNESDAPDDDDDYDDDEEEGEGEEEVQERREDDMELNELSELWGWNFDFGRANAVLSLEGLIEYIVEDDEPKRVCAAVRVLNRAVRDAKPDDPADAEKLLQWKEELIAEPAIRVCGEILQKVDERGFHNETHKEHWLYSVICNEIIELFERLGQGDALYRTKMRRNGVLEGVRTYAKDRPNCSDAQEVLYMLGQR